MQQTKSDLTFSWSQAFIAVLLGSPVAVFVMVAADLRKGMIFRIVAGSLPIMLFLLAITLLPNVPGILGFAVGSCLAFLMKYVFSFGEEPNNFRPWWQAFIAVASGIVVLAIFLIVMR